MKYYIINANKEFVVTSEQQLKDYLILIRNKSFLSVLHLEMM